MSLKTYKRNDKIMLLTTGEVLTVVDDFSKDKNDPGIIVQGEVRALLRHCEVRPAGQTRERFDAGKGVTEPEPPPPKPPNSILHSFAQQPPTES
ncbi:MAG: hypothetical protein LV479_12390 [Methylacidiphilales bacterium]|nr:hypothetical protein [Candidatus Methylacidiphilales bacterium]